MRVDCFQAHNGSRQGTRRSSQSVEALGAMTWLHHSLSCSHIHTRATSLPFSLHSKDELFSTGFPCYNLLLLYPLLPCLHFNLCHADIHPRTATPLSPSLSTTVPSPRLPSTPSSLSTHTLADMLLGLLSRWPQASFHANGLQLDGRDKGAKYVQER